MTLVKPAFHLCLLVGGSDCKGLMPKDPWPNHNLISLLSHLTSHLSKVFGLLRDELSVEIVMMVSDALVINRSSN